MAREPTKNDDSVAYLRSPRAIRDRAERLYALGLAGKLLHFDIDAARLEAAAEIVASVTRAAYPDVRAIPYHARFRHFGVGGKDRLALLDAKLAEVTPSERLASKFELVITSVLLDAGAGSSWVYEEAGGERHARSEGLAVASYDLFASGGLSLDPKRPLRADAEVLARTTAQDLERAFQARPDNPLVGLDGRAALLRRLGEVVMGTPRYFHAEPTNRLGSLGTHLASLAHDATLPAATVLGVVLDALGDIWPGRETCDGKNLGDVWTHPLVGRVPFHKLSQWLTYSLVEPLEEYGVRIVALDELTGLAEYRNGGLFVDGRVLVPKQASILRDAHEVSSSVVVEWRALTVALLDRTATEVRSLLGVSAAEMPLARVLEGGTWSAGRKLARERRVDGGPPIRVVSDGTVF